jgi:hypothetical protein
MVSSILPGLPIGMIFEVIEPPTGLGEPLRRL